MNWEQLAITFVGSGLGTTIVGLFFQQRIGRNLERQKAFLNRYSRVHERQIVTLTKLYEHLFKAQAFLRLMVAPLGVVGEQPDQYLGPFNESFTSARDEFLTGRLLLTPEIIQQCDALFDKLFNGRRELAWAHHPALADGSQSAAFLERAQTTANEEIPELLQRIEASARAVIYGDQIRLRD